jgi:hypothetical protein
MSKQSDLVSVSQGSGGDPLYIDTTNDRVGIGTTSPVDTFHAVGSDGATSRTTYQGATEFIFENNGDFSIDLSTGNANQAFINWHDTDAVQQGWLSYNHNGDYMRFGVNAAERMRIDSSGNLLVGKTTSALSSAGQQLQAGGRTMLTRDGNQVLDINRLTSDGDIVRFYKDGSTVGNIGSISGTILSVVSSGTELYIGTSGAADSYFDAPDGVAFSVFQAYDGLSDLGRPNARFDDVYATNGTIQTSDRNEKQDIEALSDAEQRVAVAAKGLLRKYRWKDAVAEKGDAARIHFGIIAQDLQAAFEAEGLDAGRYGMFISSTWWEAEVEKTREVEQEDGTTITETYTATETYDEATEGATERTRMGVRYPELLAFIIAAL